MVAVGFFPQCSIIKLAKIQKNLNYLSVNIFMPTHKGVFFKARERAIYSSYVSNTTEIEKCMFIDI